MNVIREYKELSEYMSDDLVKKATVIKEVGSNRFIVRMKSDSGSYFTATVESLDEAETVADDWVRA